MPKGKQTSTSAAKSASKTLSSKSTGKNSKSSAGSALSQKDSPQKKTSAPVAGKAAKVLDDKRTSKTSKTAAGSALSQKERKNPAAKSTGSTGPRKTASKVAAKSAVKASGGTRSIGPRKK